MAGVFLLSFFSKVYRQRAYAEFAASVLALGMLPRRWARPAALGTIAAEACVVLLVGIPVGLAPVGLGIAAGLLTVFTATILVAMRRGTGVPCRCFGASSTPLGLPHVVRNVVLLVVCLVGLVGPVLGSNGSSAPGGIAVSAATAAFLVLLVVRMDDIVALFRPDSVTGSTAR